MKTFKEIEERNSSLREFVGELSAEEICTVQILCAQRMRELGRRYGHVAEPANAPSRPDWTKPDEETAVLVRVGTVCYTKPDAHLSGNVRKGIAGTAHKMGGVGVSVDSALRAEIQTAVNGDRLSIWEFDSQKKAIQFMDSQKGYFAK